MRGRRKRRSSFGPDPPGGASNPLICGIPRRLLLRLSMLVALITLFAVRVRKSERMRTARTEEGTTGTPSIRGGATGNASKCSSASGVLRSGGGLSNIANVYMAPELLVDEECGGRKVIAFAITLTKDGSHLDGAAVLAASIDSACGESKFLCDLVAFLHDEVGEQSEAILKRLGFRVMRPGLPLDLEDIQDEATRKRVSSGGCCGSAELMKFFAYTLTEYHRVVHLDTDALVLQPLDPILDFDESLLYTTDVNMGNDHSPILPVQGGFLVVRPDRAVFADLVEVVKTTAFTGNGWGGTGIGIFWGGINVQGILPYYYEHRAPPGIEYRAIDRCMYNSMADTAACKSVDVATVRSAHFTNCQKPWMCAYPHPKNPLCTRLMDHWFSARERAETALGQPHEKACLGRRQRDYQPMLVL